MDLADLYPFPKPDDATRSVLIMDVHPSFEFNPEGPTTTEPFMTEAMYEIRGDTDGDLVADVAYRIRFSPGLPGRAVASAAASRLLPDVIHYDPMLPAAYPGNGRPLNDDVVDSFLNILTNGKVRTDDVGQHTNLLGELS